MVIIDGGDEEHHCEGSEAHITVPRILRIISSTLQENPVFPTGVILLGVPILPKDDDVTRKNPNRGGSNEKYINFFIKYARTFIYAINDPYLQ